MRVGRLHVVLHGVMYGRDRIRSAGTLVIVICVGRSKGPHTLLLRLIVPHAVWPIRNVQYIEQALSQQCKLEASLKKSMPEQRMCASIVLTATRVLE